MSDIDIFFIILGCSFLFGHIVFTFFRLYFDLKGCKK